MDDKTFTTNQPTRDEELPSHEREDDADRTERTPDPTDEMRPPFADADDEAPDDPPDPGKDLAIQPRSG